MGLFSISGTVSAIGQSIFNNDIAVYAYIEITETSGRRVSVEKVAVCNDAAAELQLGSAGEFFFDKMAVFDARFRCQLWGVKSDAGAVFDRRNIRKLFIGQNLVAGIVLLPLFGVGLLWLVPGFASLCAVLSGEVDRKRRFYGSNPDEIQRLRQQQPVRI
jgi:hypothetical protein